MRIRLKSKPTRKRIKKKYVLFLIFISLHSRSSVPYFFFLTPSLLREMTCHLALIKLPKQNALYFQLNASHYGISMFIRFRGRKDIFYV